jgi:UDP-N-acetylglucosamine acyltransferase
MIIHPTSIVDTKAKLGKNVQIGPFCIIGPDVVLDDNVELKSHIVITGHTIIGENTVIYPFASIGFNSQDDRTPTGEVTKVIIGKNNIIREYVTIQPGTTTAKRNNLVTIVGDNNLLMLGTHIAHDCVVGSNTIFANNATLAGHVVVGDYAQIGGLAAVHQYVRIGAHAIIGGVSAVVRDVVPFGMASGDRASLEGFNIVGMKRRGFEQGEINIVKQIIDKLFKFDDGVMTDRIESLSQEFKNSKVASLILEFVKQDSTRAFCEPKR